MKQIPRETVDEIIAQLNNDVDLSIKQAAWERDKKFGDKKSFWATDLQRPSVEIFWQWMKTPETNPIEPHKKIMFDAAEAFERMMVCRLIQAGKALAPTPENAERVGLPVKHGQFYITYEFEKGVPPITGRLDCLLELLQMFIPMDVKTHGYEAQERALSNPTGTPSEHYLYQLAIYCVVLDAPFGLILSQSRQNGAYYWKPLIRTGQFTFECFDVKVDLQPEFDRFSELYKKHIATGVQPKRDYEYRPPVTEELLSVFADKEIRKAIKGERVLSDHRWRPQYCNWKDLWIQQEMEEKGFEDFDSMLKYTDDEIELMMDFCGVEFRTDKNGTQKLYVKKGSKSKAFDKQEGYEKPKEEEEALPEEG